MKHLDLDSTEGDCSGRIEKAFHNTLRNVSLVPGARKCDGSGKDDPVKLVILLWTICITQRKIWKKNPGRQQAVATTHSYSKLLSTHVSTSYDRDSFNYLFHHIQIWFPVDPLLPYSKHTFRQLQDDLFFWSSKSPTSMFHVFQMLIFDTQSTK